MSRSYKKTPCYQDNCGMKKIFNRRLRRSSKCQDIPSGKAYRKVNETWNQCDYKFGWNSYNDYKKYMESFYRHYGGEYGERDEDYWRKLIGK